MSKEIKTEGSLDPLKFDDGIKSKVTNIKKVIDDKLIQLSDLLSLELHAPIQARMTHRLEAIKKMGSAQSIKIKGHWKTMKPQMFIRNLRGNKISNDEAEIKFEVYDVDENGNKLGKANIVDVQKEDGTEYKKISSIDYHIAYEVTEKIKTGKKLMREIMKVN